MKVAEAMEAVGSVAVGRVEVVRLEAGTVVVPMMVATRDKGARCLFHAVSDRWVGAS